MQREARYRQLLLNFWEHKELAGLSVQAQMFVFRLLTCRRSSAIPGVILATPTELRLSLGYTAKQYAALLRQAKLAGLVVHVPESDLLWVPIGFDLVAHASGSKTHKAYCLVLDELMRGLLITDRSMVARARFRSASGEASSQIRAVASRASSQIRACVSAISAHTGITVDIPEMPHLGRILDLENQRRREEEQGPPVNNSNAVRHPAPAEPATPAPEAVAAYEPEPPVWGEPTEAPPADPMAAEPAPEGPGPEPSPSPVDPDSQRAEPEQRGRMLVAARAMCVTAAAAFGVKVRWEEEHAQAWVDLLCGQPYPLPHCQILATRKHAERRGVAFSLLGCESLAACFLDYTRYIAGQDNAAK